MIDTAPRQRRRAARALGPAWLAVLCLVAILAATGQAVAQAPDVPGKDFLVSGDDQDLDGYAAADDCDDTDDLIFPGITILDTNFKTCQSDGTYTDHGGSTLSSLPTGTNTYFVDCDAVSNGTGTSGSPFNTLGSIALGSPGSEPAGAVALTAGDRVWWYGDCDVTYFDGTRNVQANIVAGGSSGNPAIIHAVPGRTAKVTLDGSNDAGIYINADYITVYGGEYTSSTSPVGPSIWTESTTGTTVEGGYFHDLVGNGDNNFAAIYNLSPSAGNFNRNRFVDISASTGNEAGKYGIITFFESGDTVTASNFNYNKADTTRASRASCSASDDCFTIIRFKHGMGSSGITGTHQVKGNVSVWGRGGIWNFGTSKITFSNNLIIGPTLVHAFVMVKDSSPASSLEDIIIEDNTIVDGPFLQFDPDQYSSSPYSKITTRRNVIDDDTNPYSQGGDRSGGIYRIDANGLDADITVFLAQAMLVSDNNCYNGAVSPRYGWFAQNGTNANTGNILDFSTWKSTTSQDASSIEEDPALDSDYIATNPDCDGFGWRLTGGAPTPTPSPTPSPSPTPTPVPTGTFDIGPTLRNQVRIR